jgi:hypothetical protein
MKFRAKVFRHIIERRDFLAQSETWIQLVLVFYHLNNTYNFDFIKLLYLFEGSFAAVTSNRERNKAR